MPDSVHPWRILMSQSFLDKSLAWELSQGCWMRQPARTGAAAEGLRHRGKGLFRPGANLVAQP
jgi:hypothetical protein